MFISYAQNFEDVMLWRALGGVTDGFYVDVGANDPEVDSITKAFYERGWRGINVEPVPVFHQRLQQLRERDINLAVCAGQENGSIRLYDVIDTGLSTVNAEVAEQHRHDGRNIVERDVPVTTLSDILKAHVHGPIHFLKIDVEGAEEDVIRGLNLCAWRPWVLVIEATRPMSPETSHTQWEGLVTAADYLLAYNDGLNRFYVAAEHPELMASFVVPPNVFDNFRLAREVSVQCNADQKVAELQDKVQTEHSRSVAETHLRATAEQAIVELQGRVLQAEQLCTAMEQRMHQHADLARNYLERLREREHLLAQVYASRSWRITAPIRAIGGRLRQMKSLASRSIVAPPAATPARKLPPGRRIFVECTHTYHSDLNTGIQRVVRNVLRNAPAISAKLGFEVIPVMYEGGKLVHADVHRVLQDKNRRDEAAGSVPDPKDDASCGVLRSLYRRMLKAVDRALPDPRVHDFLYAGPDRFGLAWLILLPGRILMSPWRFAKWLVGLGRPRGDAAPAVGPAPAVSLDDYSSHEGSILLLLDSSWTIPLWEPVQRFREQDGFVAGVIYDLIPVTHPHTSVEVLTKAFRLWLSEHFRVTGAFIAISRSVADQLRAFIDEYTQHYRVQVDASISHFHLGSELDFVDASIQPRPAVREVFESEQHVFLMVGSIEPRKNHAYVLDAFEHYWAAGGNATLAIIGKQGWKTEDFLDRVASHPQRGRRLFLMRDINDGELDFAYRKASALVIASEIEGFGLPVVEAFQRGLPVLCSDIPVFREIADGRASFFSLEDPRHLATELGRFIKAHPLEQRFKRVVQPWINWEQSTEQLLSALMACFQQGPLPLCDTAEKPRANATPDHAEAS